MTSEHTLKEIVVVNPVSTFGQQQENSCDWLGNDGASRIPWHGTTLHDLHWWKAFRITRPEFLVGKSLNPRSVGCITPVRP